MFPIWLATLIGPGGEHVLANYDFISCTSWASVAPYLGTLRGYKTPNHSALQLPDFHKKNHSKKMKITLLLFLISMASAFSTSFYLTEAAVRNQKVRKIHAAYKQQRKQRKQQRQPQVNAEQFFKLLSLKLRQMWKGFSLFSSNIQEKC